MTEIAVKREGAQRMGFFTDTTVCIGCKACEVACKQWNDLPSDGGTFRKGGSYDSTGRLSGNTWRHVRFVELADAGGGVRADEMPDLVATASGNDFSCTWQKPIRSCASGTSGDCGYALTNSWSLPRASPNLPAS